MKRLLAFLFALALSVSFANAQAPTRICLSNGNNCVDVATSNPFPTSNTLGGAAVSVANPLPVNGGNGYPAGAIPLEISGTGTTGVVTATLPAGALTTTYMCGFSIDSTATAGINGTATITGLTNTLSFLQGVGVAPAVASLFRTFTPCIQASAVNTTIVVNTIAAGTAGVTTASVWGYRF